MAKISSIHVGNSKGKLNVPNVPSTSRFYNYNVDSFYQALKLFPDLQIGSFQKSFLGIRDGVEMLVENTMENCDVQLDFSIFNIFGIFFLHYQQRIVLDHFICR